MAEKRLYRSCKDKLLGGVAAGVAEYFGFDISITRLIIALLVVTTGFGFLAYIIAWVVIPVDPSCEEKNPRSGADEIKEQAERVASDIKKAADNMKKPERTDIGMWLGVLILIIGLQFLFQSVFGIHMLRFFWPLWLIIIGAAILASSINHK